MHRRAFLDFAHDGRNLAHLVLSSPWLGPCIKFVSSFSITAYSSRRFYTFLLTTLHVLLCRIMLRSLTLFSCCLLLLSHDPLVQAQQCRLVAPNGLLANPSPSATPSTSPTPTSLSLLHGPRSQTASLYRVRGIACVSCKIMRGTLRRLRSSQRSRTSSTL